MQQPQAIQIKDVILNIVKAKKQRDSLQRELDLIDAQIDQQVKFMEDSVIDEILLSANQGPPTSQKKETTDKPPK